MKEVGKVLHKLFHLWSQHCHPDDVSRPRVVPDSRGLVHGTQLALRGEEGVRDDGTTHGLETSDTAAFQLLVREFFGECVEESVDDERRPHLLFLRGQSDAALAALVVASIVSEVGAQELGKRRGEDLLTVLTL